MTPVHSPFRLSGVVRALAALVAVAVLTLTGACAEPTVAEERTGYEATLNNYALREVPLEPEPAMGEDGAETTEADDADEAVDAGGEEAMEAAAPEVRQDLILDIMMERVRRSADLPGVTVDVTHADSNEQEKARYKVWIDTSDVRSLAVQKDAVIEDIDFVEGDRFHVEIRHPIPEGERGEYREFDETGSEG